MPARTDPIKAAQIMALGDAGYQASKAAAIVGLAENTAIDILNKHGRWGEIAERPVFMELRQQEKIHLRTAQTMVAAKALSQVDKTIDKASAYQAAGIYNLLRDCERLDAGEATQNIAIHSNIEVSGLDRLCDMLSHSLLPSPDGNDK